MLKGQLQKTCDFFLKFQAQTCKKKKKKSKRRFFQQQFVFTFNEQVPIFSWIWSWERRRGQRSHVQPTRVLKPESQHVIGHPDYWYLIPPCFLHPKRVFDQFENLDVTSSTPSELCVSNFRQPTFFCNLTQVLFSGEQRSSHSHAKSIFIFTRRTAGVNSNCGKVSSCGYKHCFFLPQRATCIPSLCGQTDLPWRHYTPWWRHRWVASSCWSHHS